MLMNRTICIFLSVLSGLLLSLAWWDGFSGLFLCIALIPLLIVEDFYAKNIFKPSFDIFWFSFISFFLWHCINLWWLAIATLVGAFTVILTNSILYSLIFWFFHYSKKVTGLKNGNLYLIVYWVAFEYLYLNTEISWPWLYLGNGFSQSVKLIQWYEFTGTLGGTLWVLIVNILLVNIVIEYIKKRSFYSVRKNIGISLIFFLIPIMISYIIFYTCQEKINPVSITIIQPNIDPYKDKFEGMHPQQQLDLLLDEAAKASESDIDYFVGPETAIQGINFENKLDTNLAVKSIRTFLQKYPKTNFVIGAETSREFLPGEILPVTARKAKNKDIFYEVYNSALQIDTSALVQIYHKSKLVVGVETMPYLRYFQFLERFTLNFGGTTEGLGSQDYRGTFTSKSSNIVVGPVICYESIYGEFVTGYAKNGANILFVITNDGWWGDSPGYRQHLNYSRLRAIESRRSIARSANTGISAFINQKGEITEKLGWGKRGYLKSSINSNNKLTFYVRYGDYIGRIALYFSLLTFCYLFWLKARQKHGKIEISRKPIK